MVLTVVRRHSAGLQAIAVPFVAAHRAGTALVRRCCRSATSRFPARRLPGPREAYDLSSTQSFGSGPYTVTHQVDNPSTTTLPAPGNGGLGRAARSGSGVSRPRSRTRAWSRACPCSTGSRASAARVTTTFAGRPDPFCVPLDACGASGMLTDAISGISSRLRVRCSAGRLATGGAARRRSPTCGPVA